MKHDKSESDHVHALVEGNLTSRIKKKTHLSAVADGQKPGSVSRDCTIFNNSRQVAGKIRRKQKDGGQWGGKKNRLIEQRVDIWEYESSVLPACLWPRAIVSRRFQGLRLSISKTHRAGEDRKRSVFPPFFMYLVLYQNVTGVGGLGGLQHDRRLQIANANQCREHLRECVCEQLNRGVSDDGRY